MKLTALHRVVRSTVRGGTELVSVSGVEREALEAWKMKMESVRELAISRAQEWGTSPMPIIVER